MQRKRGDKVHNWSYYHRYHQFSVRVSIDISQILAVHNWNTSINLIEIFHSQLFFNIIYLNLNQNNNHKTIKTSTLQSIECSLFFSVPFQINKFN